MITLNTLKKYMKLQDKSEIAKASSLIKAEQRPSAELLTEPTEQKECYVSLSLETLWIDASAGKMATQKDKIVGGKIYRRLEPEYFAWLRSRMLLARSAVQAGKIPTATWDILKSRFNPLQEYAVQVFGLAVLQHAVRELKPKTYDAPHRISSASSNTDAPLPCDWKYPPNEAWKHHETVTAQALAKVHAIKADALAKNWTEALLYQNQGRHKFPYGQDYGLVCFVGGNKAIGSVTERSIEIIQPHKKTNPSVLRFFKPDAQKTPLQH